MTTWDEILTFYEQGYQLSREGKMWNDIRYHCQRIQTLILEIRKHPVLSKLEHSVSVFELRLENKAKKRGALIFIEGNDNVRINFYNMSKVKKDETYDTVQIHLSDAIQILVSKLLSV